MSSLGLKLILRDMFLIVSQFTRLEKNIYLYSKKKNINVSFLPEQKMSENGSISNYFSISHQYSYFFVYLYTPQKKEYLHIHFFFLRMPRMRAIFLTLYQKAFQTHLSLRKVFSDLFSENC